MPAVPEQQQHVLLQSLCWCAFSPPIPHSLAHPGQQALSRAVLDQFRGQAACKSQTTELSFMILRANSMPLGKCMVSSTAILSNLPAISPSLGVSVWNAGQAPVPHLVEVFTSDQQGSSYTDMILNIVGDLGEAGPFELANDDQCRFIQNAHSQFHVDLADIGRAC